MKLTLIRHGESEYNVQLTDHLDSRLTETGRRQATRSAERLRGEGITRLFVSPLRRTLETAAPISSAIGIAAEAQPDLHEFFANHHYLTFPGLFAEAIRLDFPDITLGDAFQTGAPWWPGHIEDRAALTARTARFRDALLALYSETSENILIVSHSDPIGSLIEAFLRITPDPAGPRWSENCAISCLECHPDPAQPATLLFANDTTHLDAL